MIGNVHNVESIFTSLTETRMTEWTLIRSITSMFEHMNFQRISLIESFVTFGALTKIEKIDNARFRNIYDGQVFNVLLQKAVLQYECAYGE